MRERALLLALGTSGVLAMAACGDASSAAPSSNAAQPAASTGIAASIALHSTSLGGVLVDANGLTLYEFDADKTAASTCYGNCAAVWPPVLTSGAPVASAGVMAALLGTSARHDGSVQVTYGGHPLYRFVSDTKPGDTTGEGSTSFGAGWDVLDARGKVIDNGGS